MHSMLVTVSIDIMIWGRSLEYLVKWSSGSLAFKGSKARNQSELQAWNGSFV